jgi:hypothetical protein
MNSELVTVNTTEGAAFGAALLAVLEWEPGKPLKKLLGYH